MRGLVGRSYSRDVTAMVRAVVNDDAKVESYTMDLMQATRQVKNGVAVYIEIGYDDEVRRRQLHRVELPGDPYIPKVPLRQMQNRCP